MSRLKHRESQECVELILRRAAEDGGKPVAAAVVDDYGDLIAFGRMDAASPRAVMGAINKAYTAARLGRDTHVFAQLLKDQGYHHDWFGDRRFTGLKGGVAVKVGEGCLGGIGVAGRAAEDDYQLTQTALDHLNKKNFQGRD
jgi:glc operon protein GlcG